MGLAQLKEDEERLWEDIYFAGRKLPKNKNLFVSVFRKGRKEKKQISYKICDIDKLQQYYGDIDIYVTQCFFWYPSRKSEHLSSFSHFWIDLDFYKDDEKILYKSVGERGIAFRKFCADNNIPEPSRIIDSGNGAYGLWLFDDVIPERAKGMFKAALKALQERFNDWGVDKATGDFARVLRLPGTINSKTGRMCSVIWRDGPTYNFNDLCDELLPQTFDQIQKNREKFKEYKKERRAINRRRNREVANFARIRARIQAGETDRKRGAKSVDSYFRLALQDLRTLIVRRYGGVMKKGEIHNFVFHVGVLFAQLVPPESIVDATRNFIERMKPARHPDETDVKDIEAHLCTLVSKAQADHAKGNQAKGYTYKTADLIRIFGITRDEMKHMTVLIDKTERLLRKRTKRQQEGRQERPNSEGLTREQYEANSASRSKPWEALGISRATYYNRKKAGAYDKPAEPPAPAQAPAEPQDMVETIPEGSTVDFMDMRAMRKLPAPVAPVKPKAIEPVAVYRPRKRVRR